jgi:hypothetical protein
MGANIGRRDRRVKKNVLELSIVMHKGSCRIWESRMHAALLVDSVV